MLSISDSSEINLQAHVGRLKPDGLGIVGAVTVVGHANLNAVVYESYLLALPSKEKCDQQP